jgi:phytoene dehydrogenase-like protein
METKRQGHVTVVGGGLAGLVAAIACAEQGVQVTVHEAHSTLGEDVPANPRTSRTRARTCSTATARTGPG